MLTAKCTSGATIRTYAKSARRRESVARRFVVFITAIKICHPARALASPTLMIARKKSSAHSAVEPAVPKRGRRLAIRAAATNTPHSEHRARSTSVRVAKMSAIRCTILLVAPSKYDRRCIRPFYVAY